MEQSKIGDKLRNIEKRERDEGGENEKRSRENRLWGRVKTCFLGRPIVFSEGQAGHWVEFILRFFLHQMLLTPAYAVVIAFYATLFPKIGSGPLWDARIGLERDRCVESWWANIIYVNNYVNTDMLCMFQSWYIAADTQLFLISMFLVYTIWRWPTVGKILLFVVLALSLAIPFVITLISRLDPLLMMFRAELEDISSNAFFKHSYVKTHMRGTPYFLGVLLGYLVHRLQQSNKKVPKIAVWFGWILSTFLLISSLYSSNVFYDPNYRYYALDAAVFASLDKLGWSLGSSWIIFACVTKNAGPIEMFLTWKPIIPLSRLTYSAFLVNGVVVLHHLGTLRAPTYVEDISLIKILISHVVVTFLLALVLSITFESPLNAIQKILLRKDHHTWKEEPTPPDDESLTKDETGGVFQMSGDDRDR
uniref:Acyltransferase 3 domain-containing protein n=1 Tax=Timema poppense TaxID=170557 RepID=A0A7R9CW33_TIMPO|nr:unnamed protein product [Timema poppensis]